MTENEQEATSAEIEEAVDLESETSEDTAETTEETSAAELSARLKRAEAKIERMKLDALVEKKVVKEVEKIKSTGDLDETQLDYLDLKGVTEAEDIKVIEDIVKKTGQTVRQALKDDYVIAKLTANKAKRDVQGATPSSTKRAGSQSTDVAAVAAKFKETGVLPEDRALANAVVDSIAKSGNDRLPPWQR